MLNILLISVIVLCFYICFLLKKFLAKINFIEKHYLNTFDENFVEKTYIAFKKAEAKYRSSWDEWLATPDKKNLNKEKEDIVRRWMTLELEYYRAKERYFYIVESNLAVFNGQKNIKEVLDKYDNEILDTGKILDDAKSVEHRMKYFRDKNVKTNE